MEASAGEDRLAWVTEVKSAALAIELISAASAALKI